MRSDHARFSKVREILKVEPQEAGDSNEHPLLNYRNSEIKIIVLIRDTNYLSANMASMFVNRLSKTLLFQRGTLGCAFRVSSAASSSSSPATKTSNKVTQQEDPGNGEDDDKFKEMEQELSKISSSKELSSIEEYRIDMPPFAKNLFLGKFDNTVLSYPDILDNDRYRAMLERCESLRKHLSNHADLVKSIDANRHISKEITLPLKNLGIFGLRGEKASGGQGLCFTEALRVTEELSCNMSLSEFVIGQNTYAYRGIEIGGNKELKAQYLSKLLSGEMVGALCVTDDTARSDISTSSCTLDYNEYDDYFILNGKKTWVSHGPQADVFTVFASNKIKDNLGVPNPQLTAIVVDKNMEGVTVRPRTHTSCLKGVEINEVEFENVKVPGSHLLGERGHGNELYNLIMAEDRMFVGARIVSLLRECLNTVMKHSALRKSYGMPLKDFDLVKHRITEMATKIYMLESMTYMTAGLADVQKEVDVVLEAAMTRLFAINTARFVLDECRNIYGVQCLQEDNVLWQIREDIEGLAMWDTPTDILHMAVAMLGLNHVGLNQSEKIMKMRIPNMNPWTMIKERFEERWSDKNFYNRKWHCINIVDDIHPSLSQAGTFLELSVTKLKFASRRALAIFGQNVRLQEVNMYRLSTSATEIYAMASAVARANRSYCQGYVHGEHEVDLAIAASFEGRILVNKHLDLIRDGFYGSADFYTRRVSEYMHDFGGYCAEHPTIRHFF